MSLSTSFAQPGQRKIAYRLPLLTLKRPVGRHLVRPEQLRTGVPRTERPVGRQPASARVVKENKSNASKDPSATPIAIGNREDEDFFMIIAIVLYKFYYCS